MATFSRATFSHFTYSTNWSGRDTHDWVDPYRRRREKEQRVKSRPIRDERDLDRDVLRQMLEAAFADAPRDPVIVEAKREHPASDPSGPAIPLVDWSGLLANLEQCEAVLARYAERIAAGKTRTQRQEKARRELRYSEETVREAVAEIAAARRKAARRKAALLLLLH